METATGQARTIGEAAELLGISTAAVRKRVRRGKLDAVKQEDGTWLVHLTEADLVAEPERNGHATGNGHRDELVQQLRAENARLWEELKRVGEEKAESDRRRDILLSQYTDQLRSLSATTSRIADTVDVVREVVTDPPVGEDTYEPEAPPQRRSWWSRLFGTE